MSCSIPASSPSSSVTPSRPPPKIDRRTGSKKSIAFPALGTGVGGFPLDEAARLTVATVRDELPGVPNIQHVVFALRGAAAYDAFSAALATTARAQDAGR